MTTIRGALLTLFLGVAVAACGDDAEQEASDAATDYLAAVGDGDGDTACGLLTEDARATLEDQIQQQVGSILGDSCEEFIERAADAPFVAEAGLDDVDVASVEIDGDTAEVELEGASTPAELDKVDSEWRINEESIEASFLINSGSAVDRSFDAFDP